MSQQKQNNVGTLNTTPSSKAMNTAYMFWFLLPLTSNCDLLIWISSLQSWTLTMHSFAIILHKSKTSTNVKKELNLKIWYILYVINGMQDVDDCLVLFLSCICTNVTLNSIRTGIRYYNMSIYIWKSKILVWKVKREKHGFNRN